MAPNVLIFYPPKKNSINEPLIILVFNIYTCNFPIQRDPDKRGRYCEFIEHFLPPFEVMYELYGKKSWYLGFYESSRWISVPIQYVKLFRIRKKSFWNQKCQFRFEIGPFKRKYVSHSSGFLRKPQKFDEISQLISRVVEVRLLNIRLALMTF